MKHILIVLSLLVGACSEKGVSTEDYDRALKENEEMKKICTLTKFSKGSGWQIRQGDYPLHEGDTYVLNEKGTKEAYFTNAKEAIKTLKLLKEAGACKMQAKVCEVESRSYTIRAGEDLNFDFNSTETLAEGAKDLREAGVCR